METQLTKRKFMLSTQLLIEIICYAFIILFIYASFYKLLDFKFFRISLQQSPLIGPFAGLLVYVVPLGELVVSVMLMSQRTRTLGLWLSTAIMTGFTLYIAYLLYVAPELPCHCGGILSQLGWKEHLLLNGCFVALGALGIYLQKKRAHP